MNKTTLFKSPINVYFYDGNHSVLSQELALCLFDSILTDTFIVVIDDWNDLKVQQGTINALQKLPYKVLLQITVTGPAGQRGPNGHLMDGWSNGLFIAVIQKTQ